jgi:hypothetical protein
MRESVLEPRNLRRGDVLDRDGTDWTVLDVDVRPTHLDVAVQRISCNGLVGRYRLRISHDEPLVVARGGDGRRHVRRVQQASTGLGIVLPHRDAAR